MSRRKEVNTMNVFQAAKRADCASVCEHLGIKGRRTSANRGMFCCPFHDDKSPSMATYGSEKGFYCFSCGKHGDAVDLYAHVKSVYPVEAARAICAIYDFDYVDTVRRPRSDPTAAPIEAGMLIALLDEWRETKQKLAEAEARHAVEDRDALTPDTWMWQLYMQKASHYREQAAAYAAMTRREVLEDIRKELVALDIAKERRVPFIGFVK